VEILATDLNDRSVKPPGRYLGDYALRATTDYFKRNIFAGR